MGEAQWEVVYETDGEFQAEMLRGLLEAQEIPVVLSQEGIGRVYGLTVGPLARVQILVPASRVQSARQILKEFEQGEAIDLPDAGDDGDETDNPGES